MEEKMDTNGFKWTKPEEVMRLHQLKKRKNALQARIKANKQNKTTVNNFVPEKRKNPFAIETSENKRLKSECFDDSDTLFKLLNCTSNPLTVQVNNKENKVNFNNILKLDESESSKSDVEIVRGETFLPVDWTLKTKVRFFASKPFQWSQKLRISEEASAMTGFVRCLDTKTTSTSLDTSSNSKFHQCCLYWIQPHLPWLSLFPRTSQKSSSTSTITTHNAIKESLHQSFTDGLKSLLQLLRTRQCPYFYLCTNNFTALFRAAGISGFAEMNVMVTPTTRGFRQVLRNEDIEFKTPLKKSTNSQEIDHENDTLDANTEEVVNDNEEDEITDEEWLKQMGIGQEDIKKINFKQEKIRRKIESEIDNGAESLIFIEGVEVSAFYNFLMNSKSIVPTVSSLAGVPPTLLSPVAFNGGTVNSLKVRENKVNVDNETFFSIELQGPILPHLIHNLYHFCRPEMSVTASFSDLKSTQPFSKIKFKSNETKNEGENVMNRSGSAVFKRENLGDCGFPKEILEIFCSDKSDCTVNYDNLKYCDDSKLYNWI
ncbi:protein downstream neighbor of son homolog [Onthophagus taurus]|uniref:protein downstream neighbor of son homolog n=1 Tax=Onthophagus taurus TaxID=166361 RepID=UPI0039BE1BDC